MNKKNRDEQSLEEEFERLAELSTDLLHPEEISKIRDSDCSTKEKIERLIKAGVIQMKMDNVVERLLDSEEGELPQSEIGSLINSIESMISEQKQVLCDAPQKA